MARLKVVNVTFFTSDDDKRQESAIRMVLNDGTGTAVARAEGSYGKFDDHSVNGPFGLRILVSAEKSALLAGGEFILSWIPWHNTDQWHLSGLTVDLIFEDSTHVFITPAAFHLSNQNQKVHFPVQ